MENREKNAMRFTGFADIYESARPAVPKYPVDRICSYLEKNPNTIVDLGCGTGLSTVIWSDYALNVIGIEPSEDMIKIAKTKENQKIKFINAFSDNTTLNDNSADVVVCSQSFHWMEPKATLKEVNRILKHNGIFATIDCDWPPVALWKAEKAYSKLYEKVKTIEKETDDISNTFKRYEKEYHLKNITDSGYFRYTRELVFSNKETCDAQRFINIILSQGSLQTILKKYPELIIDDINKFKEEIKSLYNDKTFDIEFCYRMRIGIK